MNSMAQNSGGENFGKLSKRMTFSNVLPSQIPDSPKKLHVKCLSYCKFTLSELLNNRFTEVLPQRYMVCIL